MYTPGPFAYLVFFLWIPVAAVLFSQKKPATAAFVVVVVGTMVLPERVAFDAPVIPALNKHMLATTLAFFGLVLTAPTRRQRMRFLQGAQLFFFIMVIGNIGTASTNPESYVFGGKLAWVGGPRHPVVIIPPLKPSMFISMTISDLFQFVMPFAVGQMMVQSREDLIAFLKGYVYGAVIYVPFMLYEGVMSPQFHNMIYGYHAVAFGHSMRGNGFKPTVLMRGGLGVAMFQFVGLTGAFLLARLKHNIRPSVSAGMASGLILFSLVVSRNVGVVIYAIVAVPLLKWGRPRTMTRLATVLALLFVTFPITRAKNWFPADEIITYVESKSAERASSLGMRFDNEMMLIEHTANKPLWGWGSYGRNRRYDPDSGKDISVTDGEWAIHYSVRGGIGVIAWFWLMALPALWGGRMIRRVTDPDDRLLLAAVTLTAAINAVDLLPNSSFTSIPILYSGILAGFLQHLGRKYRARG